MASKTLPASGTFSARFYCRTSTGPLGPIPGLVAAGTLLPKALAFARLAGFDARALPSRETASPLGFAVEDGFVLQAIVAREAAHQRAVHPIVEHPAHIFPRDACHRGEVALGDFLPNEDAPLAEVTAERLGEVQQCARNASLHGEKVGG